MEIVSVSQGRLLLGQEESFLVARAVRLQEDAEWFGLAFHFKWFNSLEKEFVWKDYSASSTSNDQ